MSTGEREDRCRGMAKPAEALGAASGGGSGAAVRRSTAGGRRRSAERRKHGRAPWRRLAHRWWPEHEPRSLVGMVPGGRSTRRRCRRRERAAGGAGGRSGRAPVDGLEGGAAAGAGRREGLTARRGGAPSRRRGGGLAERLAAKPTAIHWGRGSRSAPGRAASWGAGATRRAATGGAKGRRHMPSAGWR